MLVSITLPPPKGSLDGVRWSEAVYCQLRRPSLVRSRPDCEDLPEVQVRQVRGQDNLGWRWSGWIQIIGILISLATLLGVSGYSYDQIWQRKSLTYAVLPTHDLGQEAFGGIVVENRGRVALTDVQIVLADLASPIGSLNIPGAHEPATVTRGGVGEVDALIEIPRLSRGASVSIYILSPEANRFVEDETLFVSSNEIVGVAAVVAERSELMFTRALSIILLVTLVLTGTAFYLQLRWTDR